MMGSTRASSAEGLQLLNIVAMLIVLVATVALPDPPRVRIVATSIES